MRVPHVSRWLPEVVLCAVLIFLALERLGTFPAPWADDSLFMIVAKEVAAGRGYVLPILGWQWPHPFILAVGPTLILPSALAIKIFGFSVAAARAPMVLYLLLAIVASYLFVRRTVGRGEARLAAALLITLSAFLHTGKPLLGEIPAFAFLMSGLLLLIGQKNISQAIAAGLLLGCAVITKLPFGLILPALGVAWLVALLRNEKRICVHLTVTGITTGMVLVIGAYFLGALERGFYNEIQWFIFGGSTRQVMFDIVRRHPWDLWRLPYAHYSLIFLLGGRGLWSLRRSLQTHILALLMTLIILFTVYFLNGPGWYRMLLPSTLLLFLFAAHGARTIAGKYAGTVLIIGIISVQGWWLLGGYGATDTPEAQRAAQVIAERFADQDLVILPAEVFVHLPPNPHWLLLSAEMELPDRRPSPVRRAWISAACLPLVKKMQPDDPMRSAGHITPVYQRFVIVEPPATCSQS